MRIKKLQIKNFKSLVDFELEDLKPFCAFVGPNASGKSNIFEALEFTNYLIKYGSETPRFFGGTGTFYSYSPIRFQDKNVGLGLNDSLTFNYEFADFIRIYAVAHVLLDDKKQDVFPGLSSGGRTENMRGFLSIFQIRNPVDRAEFIQKWEEFGGRYDNDYEQFADNFTRIFIGKKYLNRTPSISTKLSPDGSNLSEVIGSIFESKSKREDFTEWLRLLIPEFSKIEIRKSNLDGSFEFFIYEKSHEKPFPINLISDGTYNILTLMAAVYQTDEPQFICIEEPENGLHPQAIELLVDFFREKCEEEGHYIWLNTHSQTLVRCLEIDEIILVNKIDGSTRAKQLTKADEVNIKTDEAWLTNALGGGVLWSK